MTRNCAACGFDVADYTQDDLLGTLRALVPMWRTMTMVIDDAVLATSPSPDAESPLDHVRATAAAADAPTVTVAVAQLDTKVAQLQARTRKGEHVPLDELVHAGIHRLRLAGRALHALGAGAPRQHGTLAQINASGGGVPKTPLPSATVDRHGIVGDVQADRHFHGRPWQALSLWSTAVIDALVDEGHHVHPGSAGENLTLAEVDWTTIRPGVRLHVGEVALEVSSFATPCAKNAQWFSDRDFRRIDHNRRPGWSRAYAWVLEGGEVEPGDPVVVEP